MNRLFKQVIRDNPENTDAILALTQSYEANNEHEKAYEIMVKNKNLFHEQDYDYNYAMARLCEHNAKQKKTKEDCEDAILFYDKVISLAQFFHFPIQIFLTARDELYQLNRVLAGKNKLLWSLETFLQRTDQLSISSMLAFKGSAKSLKLNFK
jgi:hypothetical protein